MFSDSVASPARLDHLDCTQLDDRPLSCFQCEDSPKLALNYDSRSVHSLPLYPLLQLNIKFQLKLLSAPTFQIISQDSLNHSHVLNVNFCKHLQKLSFHFKSQFKRKLLDSLLSFQNFQSFCLLDHQISSHDFLNANG